MPVHEQRMIASNRVNLVTPNPDDLLTAEEVASMLRLRETTLANWRIKGCGPKWLRLPNSRAVRYRRSVVDAWLQNVTYQSTAEADEADEARARLVS